MPTCVGASIRADICMLYMSNAHCSTDDMVRGLVGGEAPVCTGGRGNGSVVVWADGERVAVVSDAP